MAKSRDTGRRPTSKKHRKDYRKNGKYRHGGPRGQRKEAGKAGKNNHNIN